MKRAELSLSGIFLAIGNPINDIWLRSAFYYHRRWYRVQKMQRGDVLSLCRMSLQLTRFPKQGFKPMRLCRAVSDAWYMSKNAVFKSLALAAISVSCSILHGQAVELVPPPGSRARPVSYRGMVPGITPASRLIEQMGEPLHEAPWYAWKMLYASQGQPGALDAFHLFGGREKGKIGTIEAATIPPGLENAKAIRARLGEPEFELILPGGQRLLDYSLQGVRFTLSARLRTIGVAYFPHGYRRVPPGYRKLLDLGHLRQGPQPTPPSPPDPGLLAGAFEIDISPAEAAWLKGAFKIHDPLRARCAVFARGTFKVAIVGADLFGLLKSEVDPMEARLRRLGISHLLFGMSHNHAAPDTVGIYGIYPERYVRHVQDRVVEGVGKALGRLLPVKELRVSSDGLSLAGARVSGLFRNARNPGIVDPQIAVVQARGKDGRALVTLVHFACHVEGLAKGPREISADFPGYMCDEIRRRSGAPALFLNGAIGGMVSGDTRARSHEEARKAGLRLAGEVARILKFAVPSSSSAFTFRRRSIEVPVTNPRLLLFEKLSKGRRPFHRGRVTSELFHVTLGDAEFLTMPGELLPEVSFELLEKMKGYPRMIVGLCNDELGYIVPAADFRKGAYEESMSVGPAIAPVVHRRALELLSAQGR